MKCRSNFHRVAIRAMDTVMPITKISTVDTNQMIANLHNRSSQPSLNHGTSIDRGPALAICAMSPRMYQFE